MATSKSNAMPESTSSPELLSINWGTDQLSSINMSPFTNTTGVGVNDFLVDEEKDIILIGLSVFSNIINYDNCLTYDPNKVKLYGGSLIQNPATGSPAVIFGSLKDPDPNVFDFRFDDDGKAYVGMCPVTLSSMAVSYDNKTVNMPVLSVFKTVEHNGKSYNVSMKLPIRLKQPLADGMMELWFQTKNLKAIYDSLSSPGGGGWCSPHSILFPFSLFGYALPKFPIEFTIVSMQIVPDTSSEGYGDQLDVTIAETIPCTVSKEKQGKNFIVENCQTIRFGESHEVSRWYNNPNMKKFTTGEHQLKLVITGVKNDRSGNPKFDWVPDHKIGLGAANGSASQLPDFSDEVAELRLNQSPQDGSINVKAIAASAPRLSGTAPMI